MGLENNHFIGYAPSLVELTNLKAGDVVKLAANGERFWCIISSRSGDFFEGVIDTYTISPSYPYGSIVAFSIGNIHDIHPDN